MKIIIYGAGKLGSKLAELLSQKENYVAIVDTSETALEKINQKLDVLTLKANGAKLETMNDLAVKSADFVIAVTSSDETNILIATMAKKLGCKKVVARVRNPEYSAQISFIKENMNIDFIVNPDLLMAKKIMKYLPQDNIMHIEEFAKGFVKMADFKVEKIEGMSGKKLKDLNISGSILIAAILREGKVIIPHGDTELISSDIVYMIGSKESINEYCDTYEKKRSKKAIKRVMILGGGKAGFYLADKLSSYRSNVKIIERSKNRCMYLAEQLENAVVIHGDGTDINLLESENVSEMDALITVTGFDEDNLLLALLGKQYGVKKAIAKVSRPSYIPIIERLGIDVAVNPVLITVAEILRFIQGGRIEALSILLDGQAEVVEAIIDKKTKITNRKIADLAFPKGIIIGAIVHEDKVTIPSGESVICEGDRVVVFCTESEIATVEKLFYKSKGGLLDELWRSYKDIR
ncbi:MAG: Trk system potassium transporter TrkA [Clostridiales bacterium]|nr:Trk system potassium transporter TrkA [Clostridiales bacterium]